MDFTFQLQSLTTQNLPKMQESVTPCSCYHDNIVLITHVMEQQAEKYETTCPFVIGQTLYTSTDQFMTITETTSNFLSHHHVFTTTFYTMCPSLCCHLFEIHRSSSVKLESFTIGVEILGTRSPRCLIFGILRMELASYHPPGTYNFEMAPRFLKNLFTPDLV